MPTGEPLGLPGRRPRWRSATATGWSRLRPRLLAFAGRFNDLLVDRLLGEIDALAATGRRPSATWPRPRRWRAARGCCSELAPRWRRRPARAARRATARGTGAADALLAEAAALAERGGNRAEARRLRRTARAGARPARARGALPAGLSAREAEVLRLVAAGLSNREIADALSLSEKTVENHLTSIYGKIGADNRASRGRLRLPARPGLGRPRGGRGKSLPPGAVGPRAGPEKLGVAPMCVRELASVGWPQHQLHGGDERCVARSRTCRSRSTEARW